MPWLLITLLSTTSPILVNTFQLLVRHTVVNVTGGDYSEAIRSISSRVEHVSNVAAHTSIACTINLTPQTLLLNLGGTKRDHSETK